MNEPTDTNTGEIDQYDALLRSMEPELIITVNDNEPTTHGWPEMVVEYVSTNKTHVWLSDGTNQYVVRREGDRLIIGEQSERRLAGIEEVTTIEILGINGWSTMDTDQMRGDNE